MGRKRERASARRYQFGTKPIQFVLLQPPLCACSARAASVRKCKLLCRAFGAPSNRGDDGCRLPLVYGRPRLREQEVFEGGHSARQFDGYFDFAILSFPSSHMAFSISFDGGLNVQSLCVESAAHSMVTAQSAAATPQTRKGI